MLVKNTATEESYSDGVEIPGGGGNPQQDRILPPVPGVSSLRSELTAPMPAEGRRRCGASRPHSRQFSEPREEFLVVGNLLFRLAIVRVGEADAEGKDVLRPETGVGG